MDRCAWPPLADRYRVALEEAVEFIFARFEPAGIVAAGRIVRGEAHPASDLDIYVVNQRAERQRIQRWFNGVPAEIFVNPPGWIERYFAAERADGRPSTAHMFSTGFIVYDPTGMVAEIRARALALLAEAPHASPAELTALRYGVGDMLENALDIADIDPAMCAALLAKSVEEAVALRFWQARRWQPPWKDTLRELDELDRTLASTVRAFHLTGDVRRRIDLAREIALAAAGAEGFFEWESLLEGDEGVGSRD